MKNMLFVFIGLFAITGSLKALLIKSPSVDASEIYMPLGTDLQISLIDLSLISLKSLEKITGRRFNFVDRVCFKAGQKKLLNSINTDGSIKHKKFIKFLIETDK